MKRVSVVNSDESISWVMVENDDLQGLADHFGFEVEIPKPEITIIETETMSIRVEGKTCKVDYNVRISSMRMYNFLLNKFMERLK